VSFSLVLAGFAIAVLGGQGESVEQAKSIEQVELGLRVVGPTEVDFGVAFALRVIQVWDKQLELEPWGEEKLAPLTVRLVDTSVRENATHVEETRIFECFAFELNEFILPGLFLRAKSTKDGSQRVALGEELRIGVRSSLPADDPGLMEMPRDVFLAPFPWGLALTSIAALSLISVIGLRVYRRRPIEETYIAPEPPHVIAAERIALLRSQVFETREEVRAFHVEISAIVRAYIEGRFDVEAPGKTTDEFFADPGTNAALEPEDRERLSALLSQSDLVKYAGQASGSEERDDLLGAIEVFVEHTHEQPQAVLEENA